MADDQKHTDNVSTLESYGKFLVGLYVAGGLPLVVVGIGAFLIFSSRNDATSVVVSGLLIVAGALIWGVTTYISFIRWKAHAEIIAEHDRMVLGELIKTVVNDTEAKLSAKQAILGNMLQSTGTRSLAQPADPKQPTAPPSG